MSTAAAHEPSWRSYKNYKTVGRFSICHANTSQENHIQTKYNKEQMKPPDIVIEDENGELNQLDENCLDYDYKRLNPTNTLDAALAQNNSHLLTQILASTASVSLDTLNASGGSPIHEAAFQGKLSCLDVLIKFGADLNLRDKEGWTPLHAAICGGDSSAVLMLLLKGANINAVTNEGIEPLDMALQCGDKNIIEILTQRRYARTKNRSASCLL